MNVDKEVTITRGKYKEEALPIIRRCDEDKQKPVAFVCAQLGKALGLWSRSTYDYDIAMSLLRLAAKSK